MANATATASAPLREIIICASDAPRDQAFTRRLARDIQKMGYIPRFHRRAGEGARPAAEIARARDVIVVLSPQLADSPSARVEYVEAVQRRTLIIPVQTGAVMQIPPELEHIQWIDFYEMYERGLVNLGQALTGHRQPAALRRLRIATVASKIVPFARVALAGLLMVMWLVLLNNLYPAKWSFIFALLPALFIAVGDEQYRLGDPVRWRITLTRILTGAAGAALFALLGLLILPANTVDVAIVGCTLVGGFLGWLFTRIEQRSLSRGLLGASRALSIFRFLANTTITFLALVGFSASAGERPTFNETISGVTFATAINLQNPWVAAMELGVMAVAAVMLAAEVEWLRSPTRRIKTARRQLVEMGKAASQIGAKPGAPASVFISHSSGDNEFVIKLSHDLQQRGITVWMDRRQLKAGMSWPDEIRQALEGAQTALLALSSLALASDWVRKEYQGALAQGKRVIVMRLDDACVVPAELSQAHTVDFATLYSNGLADLLAALSAGQEVVAAARLSLSRRLRYAWLINTVRLVNSIYLILARMVVFGVVSFSLLGGFDRVVGTSGLASYMFIWLGRAAPGAVVGLFVGLTERARIEGAKPSRWIALGQVIKGLLTGEGLLGVWSVGILGLIVSPVSWIIVFFFNNQSLWDLVAAESAGNAANQSGSTPVQTLIVWGSVLSIGVVNAALAIPLTRAEQRSREEGKLTLLLLSRIYQFVVRVGIGLLGLVVPLYVLFLSPITPFGPPPPLISGPFFLWVAYGLAVGTGAAAIELFFFPAGPSRRALNKLRKVVFARQERRESAPVASA